MSLGIRSRELTVRAGVNGSILPLTCGFPEACLYRALLGKGIFLAVPILGALEDLLLDQLSGLGRGNWL